MRTGNKNFALFPSIIVPDFMDKEVRNAAN